MLEVNKIYCGDCVEVLKTFPSESVNCCVTSPPYFNLRDYGVDGQLGAEKTPEGYVQNLVEVLREVKRVLKKDGTLWLNLGDSYAGSGKGRNADGKVNDSCAKNTQGSNRGSCDDTIKATTSNRKPKDLIGIPWMVAFALRADGWYLRQEIIWSKPNAMPESVKDRCTRSHEHIFMLSKSRTYYYDNGAIKEPAVTADRNSPRGSKGTQTLNAGRRKQDGINKRQYTGFNDRYAESDTILRRNKRDVWTVSTKPFKGAHFATFPCDLIEPCILSGCPKGGVTLDPFFGSGTVGVVALINGRNYIGIDLNSSYCKMAQERLDEVRSQIRLADIIGGA